ncbi:MAG: lysoplasmalogenase [Oceanicaulis sp.]|nr:lysoplasmalogenase [Oceanicaulis sp.]
MTDRYTDAEPLIPDWAGPVYLAVSVITSVIYFGLDSFTASTSGLLAVTKALSIVLLAAYAGFSRAPLLALALLASAGGDFALALTPPEQEAGIAFFAAAHILYGVIFALAILQRGWRPSGLALAAGLAVFGVAMLLWLRPGMGDLAGPASAYLGIILAMAILAGFVKGPRLIVTGALIFIASDAIIAARWFGGTLQPDGFDWPAALIWILYYTAQVCLALGIVRMKRMIRQA